MDYDFELTDADRAHAAKERYRYEMSSHIFGGIPLQGSAPGPTFRGNVPATALGSASKTVAGDGLIPQNPRVVQVWRADDDGGQWTEVQVWQDTGSEDCWVSPRMAKYLGLKVQGTNDTGFLLPQMVTIPSVVGFDGLPFQSSKMADLEWRGKWTSPGESETMMVFVGPEDLPVSMIVGREFLNSKTPREFDQFWKMTEKSNALILVSKKAKKKEKEKQKSDANANESVQVNLERQARESRQRTRESREGGYNGANGGSGSGSSHRARK